MNVAFIPVRGGSKSIPLKNVKIINGKPLVYWAIKAACECSNIDKVYVATESLDIKNILDDLKKQDIEGSLVKMEVIGRSNESATDTASTESAMLEFAEQYKFDNIVLIQATSPLISAEDLERGFEEFYKSDTDSVLSVVPQKRFYWTVDAEGYATSTNYDIYKRPRRQDFNGGFVENGAFYISSKSKLMESRNRISGNIRMVEMPEDTFFEIDEPSDWIIVEGLLKKRCKKIEKITTPIKMVLTDCDGCLTDGGMYYSEHGDELKKFNTRDGMAFSLLKDLGIIVGIITSENVELNRRRASKLKLDVCECGCKDKLSAVQHLAIEYGIDLKNILYIGDDQNDIELLQAVGYGCCPIDATVLVKRVASFILSTKGGNGVIREIYDRFFSGYIK